METKDFIRVIRGKSKEASNAAMRQALCYYLSKEEVPCIVIRDVLHCTRANVYNSIKQAKDMLEVGDKIMQAAYEEVTSHKIRIVSCTAEVNILSRFIGYKIVIDNVIL